MKNMCVFCCSLVSLILMSCSELVGVGAGITTNNEGGDVPPTIQFQNYKFRTGAGFKATQLGAVGLARKKGNNVFEIKSIPQLSNLALKRSATFTKGTRSNYELLGNLSLSQIKDLNVEANGKRTGSKTESGLYTIYYTANIKDLVDQLNKPMNRGLKDYLARSKNSRVITAIVKVNSHSLLIKNETDVNVAALAQLQTEGTAQASTKSNNGAKSVEVKDTGTTLKPGLKLADGGTYAYEYSRVIWNKNTGKIVDLLVDRPGRWYSFGDSNDHDYQNGTHDPKKVENWLK